MFTQTDLTSLTDEGDGALRVSVFVPTAKSGVETMQGRIFLKNAIAQARIAIAERGLENSAADELLAPAEAMVEDAVFWQHQSEGLAIFLGAGLPPRHFRVPISVAEEVVVADAFVVGPLLPLLSADGSFTIVTVTAKKVRLFEASRFALDEIGDSGLPTSLQDSMGESEYENPLQATPIARPHTGNVSISNAQVYGDSPPEWREAQTREFASRVAAALAKYRASDPRPMVLLSSAEYIGLLASTDAVTDSVDINPESLDDRQLHEVAYEQVRTTLDSTRTNALDKFLMLHGRADPRAVLDSAAAAQAGAEGRVETLFYRHVAEPGSEAADEGVNVRNVVNAAVIDTLRNGGNVFALNEESPIEERVAAILRY